MRDPERIDRMLAVLSAYWKRNPDLRLLQIIGNYGLSDSYWIEDEEFEAWLRRQK